MGLFDAFKRPRHEVPARPKVCARESLGTLCAPVSGRVIAMGEVPDPVFSSETLGAGCAVWPEEGTVFAPISGTVSAVMGHAVGLTGDDGVEVLVHVGIDTVEMGGSAFTALAKTGDRVRAGEGLLSFDRGAIASAGHPDCVVLAVSETAGHGVVRMVIGSGDVVRAGEPVLRLET